MCRPELAQGMVSPRPAEKFNFLIGEEDGWDEVLEIADGQASIRRGLRA